MKIQTCSVDSCDAPVVARGWCRKHYGRWQRTGRTEITTLPEKQCEVDGCQRVARTKGLCLMHYKRRLKSGDPLKVSRVRRGKDAKCTVAGCEKPHWAKGFCTNHYALMRRNGSPEIAREFRGWYIKDGYRYVLVGYRHYEPEHRVIMERHLGRRLGRDEHVHHKDENTLNNDLSNLEILSPSEHMNHHRTKINQASAKVRRNH